MGADVGENFSPGGIAVTADGHGLIGGELREYFLPDAGRAAGLEEDGGHGD